MEEVLDDALNPFGPTATPITGTGAASRSVSRVGQAQSRRWLELPKDKGIVGQFLLPVLPKRSPRGLEMFRVIRSTGPPIKLRKRPLQERETVGVW